MNAPQRVGDGLQKRNRRGEIRDRTRLTARRWVAYCGRPWEMVGPKGSTWETRGMFREIRERSGSRGSWGLSSPGESAGSGEGRSNIRKSVGKTCVGDRPVPTRSAAISRVESSRGVFVPGLSTGWISEHTLRRDSEVVAAASGGAPSWLGCARRRGLGYMAGTPSQVLQTTAFDETALTAPLDRPRTPVVRERRV